MCEYKLMNREELTDYILDFWLNFGMQEHQEEENDYLWTEIYYNLGSFDGIEQELDAIRCEFEKGWSENSREYEELDKLWNYINWYKTNFKESNEV